MTGVNPSTVSPNPLTGKKNMGEVRDLTDVAKRLNEQSDALGEILATLNKKLAGLRIGLEVWPYETHGGHVFCIRGFADVDEDDKLADKLADYRMGWALGYAKLDHEWSLCVRRVFINDSGPYEDVIPADEPIGLLKAPRRVRIEAVKRFSGLIDQIKLSAENGVKAIQQARAIAEKL